MAENDPNSTDTDNTTLPTIEPDRGTKPAKDTGRWAAFDQDLGQYVGGVHDSQAKATKAAKDRKVKRFTVVEV